MTIDVNAIFNQCIKSLSMRWLSSDPIRIGDVSLPLRPVVGLLAGALGLLGINALLTESPDTAQRNPAGSVSVAMPVYQGSVGQYRPDPGEFGGYRADSGAGAPPPWFADATRHGGGYPPQLPALASYRVFPDSDGNSDGFGYPYGGARPLDGYARRHAPGYREAGPAPPVYQGFRFREQAVVGDRTPANWANRDGYRFRPLNDQERKRMYSAAEMPFVPDAEARSLYDELGGAYGGGLDWQSAPARADYSRTW